MTKYAKMTYSRQELIEITDIITKLSFAAQLSDSEHKNRAQGFKYNIIYLSIENNSRKQ